MRESLDAARAQYFSLSPAHAPVIPVRSPSGFSGCGICALFMAAC